MKTMIVKMLCIAVLMLGFSSAAFAADTSAAANCPSTPICRTHGAESAVVGRKAGHETAKHTGKAHKHHHKHHHKK